MGNFNKSFKKVSRIFMAFAKGQVSTEGAQIKRYWGVAPVYVLGVNPSKSELEKFYNTTLENEPEYLSEIDVNGQKVKSVRLDFVVKTDAEKCNGIELTTKVSFFLRNQARVSSTSGKIQVIDKYGRTAWASPEEFKAHSIPQYSNGPANIDADYRAAFVGEEELTNFLIAYLNIPSPMKYNRNENKWYMVDNPQDSEARLENIANYFKGDFSEIKAIAGLQPNNKVKVLFGIRTTDDNKQYQAVYSQMFLKNNITDYSRLAKDVEDRKANGSYPTTEFKVDTLQEYSVEATSFDKDSDDEEDMPDFGGPTPWGN